MPTISVIIPSYNCEKYINQTINSILDQTFRDIEIIVIDDGSTDKTQKLVRECAPRVRLITQNNAGVCAARNHGIREAKGEFICLMDHDDYWFPHKLSRQLAEFERYPDAGVVYSTFILWHVAPNGQFPETASFDLSDYPDDINPELTGWIYHQFLLDCWMLTSTAMFRADVFQKCGTFDESLPYSEDWELWLRISREYPFVQLRRPTTLYRQHAQQGNRRIRNIDYRTTLLTQAVDKWGLCSPDGRCVSPRQFRKQLAKYHIQFGLGHLLRGDRRVALNALCKACLTDPLRLKYIAYVAAALAGWRPNW